MRKFNTFKEAEDEPTSPFRVLEKKYMRRCQMGEGFWQNEIDDKVYCMYDGNLTCPYREKIPDTLGAGALCRRKDGIPE